MCEEEGREKSGNTTNGCYIEKCNHSILVLLDGTPPQPNAFLSDPQSTSTLPRTCLNHNPPPTHRDTHLLLLAVAEWIHQRGGCQLQIGQTIGCKLCMLLKHLLHALPFLVLLCVGYLDDQRLSASLHTRECIHQRWVSVTKGDYRDRLVIGKRGFTSRQRIALFTLRS